MSQLISGFPLVLAETSDADAIDLFRRHSVTMSGGSTVFYTALLAAQRHGCAGSRPLPSLRVLKAGGAPCPPAVSRAVREEMGVTVAHVYGMTEVPMICVASPLDTDDQMANSDGKPIPGSEVRIVDDTAGLLPQKLPEQVEIVSELPRTGLVKVAKLALRDTFTGASLAAEQ